MTSECCLDVEFLLSFCVLKVRQSRNDFFIRCFFQKTNERIQLYYYDTSGRHFLEEIEDTKKTFRNSLTFRNVAKIMLPNDALHNFVKKLKAAIYVQTLELFLTEHF